MNRVMVRSVFDAFEYVMDHYYPVGLEEFAERLDSYAVISIQDTHNGGFGFTFQENAFCQGVLTLYFDDIIQPAENAVLFTREMAEQIIDFIKAHQDAYTLLVHCFGGQSRSAAVGAFAVRMMGEDDSSYFRQGSPNRHVYDTLVEVWQEKK